MIASIVAFSRRHALSIAASAVAVLLVATAIVPPRAAAAAIDFDLLLVLFALLVAVDLIRLSGWLDAAVVSAVSRFQTTRAFACALVLVSGALAAVVTNDVALFVVIPFTVAASRVSDFDMETAIVLEVIATNLIGCLTPIGNPQNLFIFERSGMTPGRFVLTMAPFVAWGAFGVFMAVIIRWRRERLEKTTPPSLERVALPAIAGAVCVALILLHIFQLTGPGPAAIFALVAGLLILRRRLFELDLSIIPIFVSAFVVVAALQRLPIELLAAHLYAASIILSQFISNVPAAVLLAPLAHGQWKTLLYGVSAGSCGTIIASLANLLGWRIYQNESGRDPRFFWRITALNFVFLLWISLGGWLLL